METTEHDQGSAEETPIRVQAFPAQRTQNPIIRTINATVNDLGRSQVHLSEFRSGLSWTEPTDLVHLHWPEAVVDRRSPVRAALNAIALLVTLRIQKLRRARIVKTIHDDGTHERTHPRLLGLLSSQLDRLIDGFIIISEGQRDLIPADGRNRPHAVIPLPATHGPTPGMSAAEARAEARASLGLPPGPLIASVGRIKPYKQIPLLIEAFSAAAPSDVHLLVAGESTDPEMPTAGSGNLILRLGQTDDETYRLLLLAADVLVLPYRDHLNSNAAIDALALGRRVAMTRSLAGDDLGQTAGPWLRFIESLEGDWIGPVLSWAREPEPDGSAPDFPSFESTAAATIEFYRRIADATPVTAND